MKILIIHLSDIHITNSTNHLEERAIQIVDSVKNTENEISHVFLIITGDIAFSGHEVEYNIAADFFDKLKDEIETKIQTNINFIVVPGNHDCLFIKDQEDARNEIINSIKQKKFEISGKSIVDLCIKNQENFFNNCYTIYCDEPQVMQDKLFFQHYFKVEDFGISFNCINTAWISILNETNQYGHLGFPISYLCDPIESDFVITLFHHPLNWFDGNNSKNIKKYIQENSDFVLTGHEHEPNQSSLYDYKGKKHTEYLEGGVLNNNENILDSSFNVLLIDIEKRTHKILEFSYADGIYLKEDISNGWIANQRAYSKTKNKFVMNEHFHKWLNDPGATIYYQYSDHSLSLNDIFVYPELKKTLKDEQAIHLNDKISSEKLLIVNQDTNKAFIIGSEVIGKTTLLKKLYLELHNKGYLPVYIDGFDIRETSPDSFRSLILKNISNQYIESDYAKIEQLDYRTLFILIDNFHKTKLPLRYKARFISNNFVEGENRKIYPNVFICGNDSMQFEEIIYKDDDYKNPLIDFANYAMLPFGFKMRYKLIEKWYSNGAIQYEDKEFIYKIEHAERIITSNLGENYIPSFPLFILVHLHKLDLERESELKTSSYGYYYEYLIITSISRLDSELLDSYLTYLTLFAFFLYSNKSHEITRDEFEHYDINIFRKKHRIAKDLDSIIQLFKDAGIIEESNALFKIKHNYIYYFFLARYFRETISSKETRNEINKLIQKLYKDENANILIFLTHLSKDNFIVSSLVENSREIFKKHAPLHINDDCDSIDSLIENLPKLIVNTKNIRENREKQREELDRGKNYHTKPDYNIKKDDEEEKDPMKDIMDNLRKSFKTLQVLGQVGKNYHGSLTIMQLHDVIEEAYLLGLRSVNSFISLLEDNTESFVALISDRLDKLIKMKNIELDESKKNDLAKKIAFGLCGRIIANMLRRISFSVGANKLLETYKEIYDEYDWNSVKLIDILLKFDHNPHFPIKDIISANKSLSKKKMSSMLITIFIKNYLELYPVDISTMQKLSSEFDFDIDALRLLAQKQKNN